MNEVITIENTEMQIREYNGQRVVTFKDIDTVHQRPSGTARKTFNRNKKHFEAGKHYFVLKTDEARKLYNMATPNGLVILNERGYLMLVKAFTDDLSWQVQDRLVEVYFGAKDFREEFVTIDELAELRSGHQKYLTSSTPVPKNPSWYDRNKRRIKFICETAGCEHKKLYHVILSRLSDEYNINEANRIYVKEVGHKPQYAIDVVSYFPDLGRMADDILDKLEKCAREEIVNR